MKRVKLMVNCATWEKSPKERECWKASVVAWQHSTIRSECGYGQVGAGDEVIVSPHEEWGETLCGLRNGNEVWIKSEYLS